MNRYVVSIMYFDEQTGSPNTSLAIIMANTEQEAIGQATIDLFNDSEANSILIKEIKIINIDE